VSRVLGPDGGPVVIASDWLKAIPDLVRPWLPPSTVTLGTDGFGRSDDREALRALFEIDGPSVAAAALAGLARSGALPARKAAKGIADLGIDPDKTDPLAL
jgi:pyruvate dehydrogenase E1 component